MNAILQPDFWPSGIEANDLPDTVVRNCLKSHQALKLAITSSGLEHQHLWKPLGIDKGSWSKIINGQAHFPNDKLQHFCKLVNNTIYLRWLNFQCDHECKPILSTLEQQLSEANELIKAKDKEIEILLKAIKR